MTTAIMTDTKTYTFEARHLSEFAARLDKIAKRASKLSLAPLTYGVTQRFTQEHHDTLTDVHYDVQMVTVEVEGTSPVLPGGWRFLGALEHDTMGNGLALVHGDDPAVEAFRYAGANCNHCGFNRNRRKTVILRNEAGDLTQVGSTCLKDFLGYHGTVDGIVAWLGYADDQLSEVDGNWGQGYDDVPLSIFMAATSATIRTFGWTPKSASRGLPTVELVKYYLGIYRIPTGSHGEEIQDMVVQIANIADDKTLANATVDYYRNLDSDQSFDLNLKAILSNEYVTTKNMGIAAYSVQGYLKSIDQAVKREVATQQRAASEWVGTVGAKIETTITVTFKKAIYGDYGVSYLVSGTDSEGNTLKTFSSGAFGCDSVIGETYKIKATIKGHEVYNEAKDTQLTRVKAVA